MASHVPFLTVPAKEQESLESTARDYAASKTASTRRAAKSAANKTTSTAKKVEKEIKKTAHASFVLIPKLLRFPALLVASLTLRLVAYTLISQWAGIELASVSRDLSKDWQVGAVFTWKILELIGIYWAQYDWVDVASLSLLSNMPFYFLLGSFYQLSAISVGTSLAIDVVSLALPFWAFKSHVASTRDEDLLRPVGKAIANDYSLLAVTSALAAAVFAAVVYVSLNSWIPLHMIKHFDDIPTLAAAHDATIYKLAALLIPAGMAAMHFLFLPTVSASNHLLDALEPVTRDEPFDAETATLAQTIAYNLGISKSLSAKTEVLIKRTTILALGSAINVAVRVFATVEGASIIGALGWAALWAAGISFVGVVYRWVAE